MWDLVLVPFTIESLGTLVKTISPATSIQAKRYKGKIRVVLCEIASTKINRSGIGKLEFN